MITLTIHDLEAGIEDNLRRRAQAHGCSMEDEARRILQEALLHDPADHETGLGSRIHARFAEVGGVELSLPKRSPPGIVDFNDPER